MKRSGSLPPQNTSISLSRDGNEVRNSRVISACGGGGGFRCQPGEPAGDLLDMVSVGCSFPRIRSAGSFPLRQANSLSQHKKLQCSLTLMQRLPLQAKQDARMKAATWSEAAPAPISRRQKQLHRCAAAFVYLLSRRLKGKTTHDVYWFNEVHH